MGGACGTYGEEDRCIEDFGSRDLMESAHMEDLGVDARDKTKMNMQEVGKRGKDWIDLAQGRDRWRALVNAVMDLRVT
jgi:coenzyme F420-reducing hydrogenase beta subunit